MKKLFENPEMELVWLRMKDVLTSSPNDGNPEVGIDEITEDNDTVEID